MQELVDISIFTIEVIHIDHGTSIMQDLLSQTVLYIQDHIERITTLFVTVTQHIATTIELDGTRRTIETRIIDQVTAYVHITEDSV